MFCTTQPLPDALRGEKWAFVQLPLGTLLGMLENVGEVSEVLLLVSPRLDHRAVWLPLNLLLTVWGVTSLIGSLPFSPMYLA